MNRSRSFLSSGLVLLASLFGFGPGDLSAQSHDPRYELGIRERRQELAWFDASEDARAAGVPALEQAVTSFFGLRLDEAGRQLDRAWLAMAERSDDAIARAVARYSTRTASRWLDVDRPTIDPRLEAFYAAGDELPLDGTIRFSITANDSSRSILARTEVTVAAAIEGIDWTVRDVPAGDHRLTTTLIVGDRTWTFPEIGLSFSRDRDGRLAEVTNGLAALRELAKEERASDEEQEESTEEALRATGAATLGLLQGLLEGLAGGDVLETDYPADRLLADAERLIADRGSPLALHRDRRGSDLWLNLSADRRRQTIRLRAPTQAEGALPVLIALHGAGGSENMFFDAYGAGRLVEMGVERGWLVVAPRQTVLGLPADLPRLLDAIEKFQPIDRSRVLLVGHSMGAAQAIRQTGSYPDRVRAVAAVGGGGSIPANADVRGVRFLVAAGDRDFGRRQARALADRLERVGAPVTWIEFEQTEHLGVMQVSLERVFEFLDDAAR